MANLFTGFKCLKGFKGLKGFNGLKGFKEFNGVKGIKAAAIRNIKSSVSSFSPQETAHYLI